MYHIHILSRYKGRNRQQCNNSRGLPKPHFQQWIAHSETNKETLFLNYMLNQMGLTDKYRTSYPKAEAYIKHTPTQIIYAVTKQVLASLRNWNHNKYPFWPKWYHWQKENPKMWKSNNISLNNQQVNGGVKKVILKILKQMKKKTQHTKIHGMQQMQS